MPVSASIALEVPAARWPTENQRGNSRPDPAPGPRESAGDPGKKWLAFLRNYREAIVGLDLFTVPTATFRGLYCLFVIEHGWRRILHCNVTRHPSADWVVQQLREFFPADPYRYAILARDSIFDADVIAFLKI